MLKQISIFIVAVAILSSCKEKSITAEWRVHGSKDAEFWYPGGIYVDSAGTLYVADTENDRVVFIKNIVQIFGAKA